MVVTAKFDDGLLRVSKTHRVYWRSYGPANREAILIIHGGPGGRLDETMPASFDLSTQRVVCFDQRGCGRSRPTACLVDNTTPALVSDMEALREFLNIDRWSILAGSWGAVLALKYALQFRERVQKMLLYSVFLGRQREVDWLLTGARRTFPQHWKSFSRDHRLQTADELIVHYQNEITAADIGRRQTAARVWLEHEMVVGSSGEVNTLSHDLLQSGFHLVYAPISLHYYSNRFFVDFDTELELLSGLAGLPVRVIHGAGDQLCRIETAQDLCQALPDSELIAVPAARHTGYDHLFDLELMRHIGAFLVENSQ